MVPRSQASLVSDVASVANESISLPLLALAPVQSYKVRNFLGGGGVSVFNISSL